MKASGRPQQGDWHKRSADACPIFDASDCVALSHQPKVR